MLLGVQKTYWVNLLFCLYTRTLHIVFLPFVNRKQGRIFRVHEKNNPSSVSGNVSKHCSMSLYSSSANSIFCETLARRMCPTYLKLPLPSTTPPSCTYTYKPSQLLTHVPASSLYRNEFNLLWCVESSFIKNQYCKWRHIFIQTAIVCSDVLF